MAILSTIKIMNTTCRLAFITIFSTGLLAAELARRKRRFTPPASPRATYNFNPGWKFIREDVTERGADRV